MAQHIEKHTRIFSDSIEGAKSWFKNAQQKLQNRQPVDKNQLREQAGLIKSAPYVDSILSSAAVLVEAGYGEFTESELNQLTQQSDANGEIAIVHITEILRARIETDYPDNTLTAATSIADFLENPDEFDIDSLLSSIPEQEDLDSLSTRDTLLANLDTIETAAESLESVHPIRFSLSDFSFKQKGQNTLSNPESVNQEKKKYLIDNSIVVIADLFTKKDHYGNFEVNDFNQIAESIIDPKYAGNDDAKVHAIKTVSSIKSLIRKIVSRDGRIPDYTTLENAFTNRITNTKEIHRNTDSMNAARLVSERFPNLTIAEFSEGVLDRFRPDQKIWQKLQTLLDQGESLDEVASLILENDFIVAGRHFTTNSKGVYLNTQHLDETVRILFPKNQEPLDYDQFFEPIEQKEEALVIFDTDSEIKPVTKIDTSEWSARKLALYEFLRVDPNAGLFAVYSIDEVVGVMTDSSEPKKREEQYNSFRSEKGSLNQLLKEASETHPDKPMLMSEIASIILRDQNPKDSMKSIITYLGQQYGRITVDDFITYVSNRISHPEANHDKLTPWTSAFPKIDLNKKLVSQLKEALVPGVHYVSFESHHKGKLPDFNLTPLGRRLVTYATKHIPAYQNGEIGLIEAVDKTIAYYAELHSNFHKLTSWTGNRVAYTFMSQNFRKIETELLPFIKDGKGKLKHTNLDKLSQEFPYEMMGDEQVSQHLKPHKDRAIVQLLAHRIWVDNENNRHPVPFGENHVQRGKEEVKKVLAIFLKTELDHDTIELMDNYLKTESQHMYGYKIIFRLIQEIRASSESANALSKFREIVQSYFGPINGTK